MLFFIWNVLEDVEDRPWSRSTTRGDTAARWSGRPRARRRGTTSTRSRGSAPSVPAFDLHHPEAAPAGVHDAAVADDNVLVSALGPADLGGNAFADEKKEG
jgi:hypothetical protein